MKHLLTLAFIALLALGTGCAWISPSGETTSDGIQVHGHWTVTVTNPDGSVDAVHEFDNALDKTTGVRLLSKLLAGRYLIDPNYYSFSWGQTQGWIIHAMSLGSTSSFGCKEPHGPNPGITRLVAQVEQDGLGPQNVGIVLKAACNVEGIPFGTHTISRVGTEAFTKYNDLIKGVERVPLDDETPVGYQGAQSSIFTQHKLETPISIENLQLLAITVRITFN